MPTTIPTLAPPFDSAVLSQLAGEVDKIDSVEVETAPGPDDGLALRKGGPRAPSGTLGEEYLALVNLDHIGQLTREMAEAGYPDAATKIEVARSRWASRSA